MAILAYESFRFSKRVFRLLCQCLSRLFRFALRSVEPAFRALGGMCVIDGEIQLVSLHDRPALSSSALTCAKSGNVAVCDIDSFKLCQSAHLFWRGSLASNLNGRSNLGSHKRLSFSPFLASNEISNEIIDSSMGLMLVMDDKSPRIFD